MRLAIGGPDELELGVSIEQSGEEVGVLPLASGEDLDRLPVIDLHGLAFGSDRADRSFGPHHQFVAGERGEDRVPFEGLGNVGDRHLGAGQFSRKVVGQLERGAEAAGGRLGSAGPELEDQDGCRQLLREGPGQELPGVEALIRSRTSLLIGSSIKKNCPGFVSGLAWPWP